MSGHSTSFPSFLAAALAATAIPICTPAQILVIGEGGFEEWPQASRLVVFGPRQSAPDLATRGNPTAIARRPIRASGDVLQMIEQAALRYGSHGAIRGAGLSTSDWTRLFRGLIEVESAYNPRARSHGGLWLGPAHARDRGRAGRRP